MGEGPQDEIECVQNGHFEERESLRADWQSITSFDRPPSKICSILRTIRHEPGEVSPPGGMIDMHGAFGLLTSLRKANCP